MAKMEEPLRECRSLLDNFVFKRLFGRQGRIYVDRIKAVIRIEGG